MKTFGLTIRLDRALARQLAALAKRTGRSRSDIARDALRRRLAVMQFGDARRSVIPFAEARGYLTDDDVFRTNLVRVTLVSPKSIAFYRPG